MFPSKVLITGMNGTVAPAIARALAAKSTEVVAWNRAAVAIDNADTVSRFVQDTKPGCVIHAALGSPDWASFLARACAEQGIPFFFISTVSVFAAPPNGPYTVTAVPNATDDYGRYKRTCEERVTRANPDAAIVRIGWQIGTARGSNNMIDFLERAMEDRQQIAANRNWIPSCSFLEDTAEAFALLIENPITGIHHVEGNRGLSFAAIVHGLNRLHGGRWNVVAEDGATLDNRLADSRTDVGSVEDRLRA